MQVIFVCYFVEDVVVVGCFSLTLQNCLIDFFLWHIEFLKYSSAVYFKYSERLKASLCFCSFWLPTQLGFLMLHVLSYNLYEFYVKCVCLSFAGENVKNLDNI